MTVLVFNYLCEGSMKPYLQIQSHSEGEDEDVS